MAYTTDDFTSWVEEVVAPAVLRGGVIILDIHSPAK